MGWEVDRTLCSMSGATPNVAMWAPEGAQLMQHWAITSSTSRPTRELEMMDRFQDVFQEIATMAHALGGPQTSLFAFSLFIAVYMASSQLLLFVPGGAKLTPLQRFRSASKCMATTHATIVVFAALIDRPRGPLKEWEYLAANTKLQSMVMDVSSAYFVADSAHMLYWRITDVGFHLHHVLCVAYAMSCRYFAQRGGVTVLVASALGELTNPIQGLLWVAQQLDYDALISVLFPAFVTQLVLIRCVISPLASVMIVTTLWQSGELLFKGWAAMCVFINIGGILFTVGKVQELRRRWVPTKAKGM